MKKIESGKKLKLKRETVRALSTDQLAKVVGGTEIPESDPVPGGCHGHKGPLPQ
jgi:hypothetical protein